MRKAIMFIMVFMVLSSLIVSASVWDTFLNIFSGSPVSTEEFATSQVQSSEIGADETCVDTDQGMAPFVPGKTTGKIGARGDVFYDYCLDSHTLMERSCSGMGDLVRNKKIDCRPGTCIMTELACESGDCTEFAAECSSNSVCLDLDEGDSKTKPGIVILVNTEAPIPRLRFIDFVKEYASGTLGSGLTVHPDECVGHTAVKQYYCLNGQLAYKTEDCDAGKACKAATQGGQVISAGAKCLDSDDTVTAGQSAVAMIDPQEGIIQEGVDSDIEINAGESVIIDGNTFSFDGVELSRSVDVEEGQSVVFGAESLDIESTSIDTVTETTATSTQVAANTQVATETQAATGTQVATSTQTATSTQASSGGSPAQLGGIARLLGGFLRGNI